MENTATEMYGKIAMYFATNDRHVIPLPTGAEENAVYVQTTPDQDGDEEGEDDSKTTRKPTQL